MVCCTSVLQISGEHLFFICCVNTAGSIIKYLHNTEHASCFEVRSLFLLQGVCSRILIVREIHNFQRRELAGNVASAVMNRIVFLLFRLNRQFWYVAFVNFQFRVIHFRVDTNCTFGSYLQL